RALRGAQARAERRDDRAYRHAGAAGDLSPGEGPGAPVRGPAAGRVPGRHRAGCARDGRERRRRGRAGRAGAAAGRPGAVMRPRGAPAALVVAGLLAGCTVGPDYRRPDVPVPPAWRQAEQPGVSPGVVPVTAWWQTFQDPVLNRLVQRAVAANLDLEVATARVREARALRGVTAADRVPAGNASGAAGPGGGRRRAPPRPRAVPVEHDLLVVGLDASWELDFWGRVRRSVEAADATVEAAEDARRDVLVILLAEVARSLVEVRGAEQRLIIARQNIVT